MLRKSIKICQSLQSLCNPYGFWSTYIHLSEFWSQWFGEFWRARAEAVTEEDVGCGRGLGAFGAEKHVYLWRLWPTFASFVTHYTDLYSILYVYIYIYFSRSGTNRDESGTHIRLRLNIEIELNQLNHIKLTKSKHRSCLNQGPGSGKKWKTCLNVRGPCVVTREATAFTALSLFNILSFPLGAGLGQPRPTMTDIPRYDEIWCHGMILVWSWHAGFEHSIACDACCPRCHAYALTSVAVTKWKDLKCWTSQHIAAASPSLG